MALREEWEKQGNWLFGLRSYLPLLIIPMFLIALYDQTAGCTGASVPSSQYWEAFCFILSLFGLSIRCITVAYVPSGTSGRNTKGQIASELNTTGIYSIVRHPLYLGNLIMILGLLLFIGVWSFALIGMLLFWIYYERIAFAEEEFLREKFGIHYQEWAEKTPAFFPRFKNWKSPSLTFSTRELLKREYHGFLAIIASFTFLVLAREIIVRSKDPQVHWGWWILFAIGLITFLILFTLKKKTKILDAPGR